ncbi:DUF1064 domain-containing protein [Paludibacteraceae bacterium OttesenSCG-928-F17]|nr:DUF1064 domain-containing protein [Paludibacteraceae bacterium OttesenSCG-928-F17]
MTIDELRELTNKKGNGNRKVRNARKRERDGITFDSGLEMYMYDLLRLGNVSFEFQKKYELQPGFRYNGVAVRAITYTVDFYLPNHNCVIDTKGVLTQQGTIRIKLLKKYFFDNGINMEIHLPKDKNECMKLLNELTNQ